MCSSLRIVGQGLAGSLLAWHALRRGLQVEIVDCGHRHAASRVAAGIINPITGQRLVKSWRIEELLPAALECYRELEAELRVPLLHTYRLRRLFRDAHEREVAQAKYERGDLRPFVTGLDSDGLWVEPAFRVDTAVVIEALRARWEKSGILRILSPLEAGALDRADAPATGATVWCRGAAELACPRFDFVGMSPAKGEIISVALSAARDPAVILNDGHWLVPTSAREARVGATFETRFDSGDETTSEARRVLAASAHRLLGEDVAITGQDCGIRVTTPDKHPIIGFHPNESTHGILNGLGSKGALLAPYLARQWCDHLLDQSPFDPTVDVARFVRR